MTTKYTELEINTDTGEVIADNDQINQIEQFGLKEDFIIDSLDRCEWYIQKINAINYQKDQLKKNYQAMQADIDRQEKSLQYLFENQFIAEIKKHIPTGKKSIKTLSGQVQFRACKPTIEICEKEAIDPKFILQETKIVEKIDKESILKAFESGLAPDGVNYIAARDSLTIK